MKLRLGKGFTLEELREAKISPKLAPTIGIAVDHRRRNRCTESLQANVERHKLCKPKLLIFPKKSGKKGVKKGDTPKSELQNVAQNTLKEIIPVQRPQLRVKARAITADEKEKSAYKTLKKARTNKKYAGAKKKRPRGPRKARPRSEPRLVQLVREGKRLRSRKTSFACRRRKYAMVLTCASALHRAFRGPREVPQTCENTAHGGPNARRSPVRRGLWPPLYEASPGAPGRPRKARCQTEELSHITCFGRHRHALTDLDGGSESAPPRTPK
jgi:hypothetical protein